MIVNGLSVVNWLCFSHCQCSDEGHFPTTSSCVTGVVEASTHVVKHQEQ